MPAVKVRCERVVDAVHEPREQAVIHSLSHGAWYAGTQHVTERKCEQCDRRQNGTNVISLLSPTPTHTDTHTFKHVTSSLLLRPTPPSTPLRATRHNLCESVAPIVRLLLAQKPLNLLTTSNHRPATVSGTDREGRRRGRGREVERGGSCEFGRGRKKPAVKDAHTHVCTDKTKQAGRQAGIRTHL